ncbi:MAG TPA: AAA family ATPase [Terriglobales bacterium]|nr:AAA family ATPase [Terriglobales bacterium]
MTDRIKRRKKDPQENKAESAQAPLQPAYFDGEVSPSGTAERHAVQAPLADVEDSRGNQADTSRTERAVSQPGLHEAGSNQTDSRGVEVRADQFAKAEAQSGSPNPRPSNTVSRQGRRRRGRGGRGRSGPRSVNSRPPIAASTGVPIAGDTTEAGQTAAQPGQGDATQSPSGPRVPKGVVILAIGLPGSGKSSWFKRHNIAPLSSDLLRALLFDDPTEQRFQDLVFSNLRSMLKARLIARRPLNYVDATNLTSHDRRGWIKLAQDYGYEVQAVFFDVPLEVCLERNRKRERVVSEDVMRRMASKQKPPTFEEGFSKITVVRVKQKD